MKEAIGYTIFRSLFPGRTHCKDLQKDSGGLLWKEAWQTQGFLLARKVLTLVTSLSEGNKDNALLPAISSIQWQNYVPISLGQVCGAGLWISSSLDSALQTWAHAGCCRHFSSSPTAGSLQDCCCHLADTFKGNQKRAAKELIRQVA